MFRNSGKGSLILSGSVIILFLAAVMYLTACGGSAAGGTASDPDHFENGGVSLDTTVSEASGTKSVTVADSSGTSILSLDVTTTGVTMSSPGQTPSSYTVTFRTPLLAVPTDFTARLMAIFAAGPLAVPPTSIGAYATVRPDSPGCDWFPDYPCTLGCCADHDACYRANSCGASSWIWGFGTDECKNCNNVAYDCIGAACTGVTDTFVADNCYDARCNERYDCPPDYTVCTCKDICLEENSSFTSPDTCGDGTCAADENLENCYADCGFGSSNSACCVAHTFPAETGTTCGVAGVSTCCCGYGYACGWNVAGTSTVNQNICVGD